MRLLVSPLILAFGDLSPAALADPPQLRCYYDCSVGPVASATAETGYGEIEHIGSGGTDENGSYRILTNSATWLGGIENGKAHGFGKWSEGGYNFYGAAKDGRPIGPGLLVVEALGMMVFGDFKVSSRTIIFDDFSAPTDVLQMTEGIGGPVIRVDAFAQLGTSFVPLYEAATASAKEAFVAEEQASDAIRAAKEAGSAGNQLFRVPALRDDTGGFIGKRDPLSAPSIGIGSRIWNRQRPGGAVRSS